MCWTTNDQQHADALDALKDTEDFDDDYIPTIEDQIRRSDMYKRVGLPRRTDSDARSQSLGVRTAYL